MLLFVFLFAVDAPLVHATHAAMGSSFELDVETDDAAALEPLIKRIFAEVDRLEGLLTVWRETSDVARVNKAAGSAPVVVHNDTLEVMRAAVELWRRTDGRFDVTFGALAPLWRFDHDHDEKVPSQPDIERALRKVGSNKLTLDASKNTAFLREAGMRVHLGGIGKGFAVDRAVAMLREAGFQNFSVHFGGDLYLAGRRGQRLWRVGIRDPRGPADAIFATLDLTDATFSTSGDYERFFFSGGKRYHHIIDLKTGWPATASRSVSVVSKSATMADAAAKAIFIAGGGDGLSLAEKLGVKAVIVDARNGVHVSKDLALVVSRQPTDAP